MTIPSEHDEQVAFCKFLDMAKIPYFAVPNGGARNIVTATRLKAEGVRRGAPDVLAFLPNGINIAIEMKRRNGGVLSSEQRAWIEFFYSRMGWTAKVCYGAKEAIEFVKGAMDGLIEFYNNR